MPKTRRTLIRVTARRKSAPFPVDMLRYDCAFPSTSEDALAVAGLSQDDYTARKANRERMLTMDPDGRPVVHLVCTRESGPTPARWQSFGWDCETVEALV